MMRKVAITIVLFAILTYIMRPKMLNHGELIGTWEGNNIPLELKLLPDYTFAAKNVPADFFGTANLTPVSHETTGSWSIVQDGFTKGLHLSVCGIPTSNTGFPLWGLTKYQLRFHKENGYFTIKKVH